MRHRKLSDEWQILLSSSLGQLSVAIQMACCRCGHCNCLSLQAFDRDCIVCSLFVDLITARATAVKYNTYPNYVHVTFCSGFPPIVVWIKNPLMNKSPRLID